MYTARPAPVSNPALPVQPRLRRVRRRAYTGAGASAPGGTAPGGSAPGEAERAFLDEYLTDLARPYGFPVHPEVLKRGGAHRYEEMVEELIGELVPATEPVDLVVLAFAVPDVRAGRSVATYRGRVCPGDPLAFALCDQGTAAAFTGLRLVRELARTGDCRRSLLLVVEQETLAYQPTVPVTLPARAAAVGLLFDRAGPARPAADRQLAGIGPETVADRFATEFAELRAGAARVSLVLGSGLADCPVDDRGVARIRTAPAGQPSTGVWWELADELAEPIPDGGRRTVLADYDPMLGYLCLAAFDLGAEPADQPSFRTYS